MPNEELYLPLKEFLQAQGKEEVHLALQEIEHILGTRLPNLARKNKAWWERYQDLSWLESGYRVNHLAEQSVTFCKISTFNLETVLTTFFTDSPLCCSEAEFQLALALKIKELYPNLELKLEYRPFKYNGEISLSIVVMEEGVMTPIEVIYKTQHVRMKHQGEDVYLKTHGAYPLGRYDFVQKIEQLEGLKECGAYLIRQGYVIMLTNSSVYYRNVDQFSFSEAFKIHDKKVLHGRLAWDRRISLATRKGREAPLRIQGSYEMNWKTFFIENQEFAYLCVKV